MPLVQGEAASTKEGFSENVRREMDYGKKQSQAVAIAYSEDREGKIHSESHGHDYDGMNHSKVGRMSNGRIL